MATSNFALRLRHEISALATVAFDWKYASWATGTLLVLLIGIMLSTGQFGIAMFFVTVLSFWVGALWWKSKHVKEREIVPGRKGKKRTKKITIRSRQWLGIAGITILWAISMYAINDKRIASKKTGSFIQPSTVVFDPEYNVIDVGKELRFGVIFENTGPLPIHDVYHTSCAVVMNSAVRTDQAIETLNLMPAAPFSCARGWNTSPEEWGIKLPEVFWYHVDALNQSSSDGIMNGTLRIFILYEARWKDSNNLDGKLPMDCRKMVRPRHRLLIETEWMSCDSEE